MLTETDLAYLTFGVVVGSPLATRLQALYSEVERRAGSLSWQWDLFTLVTIPLTSTAGAVLGGALLGWRLSDPWVGATWAAAGGIVSPYLWPSVLKALRSKASAGISALTSSLRKEPPDDPQPRL